MAERIPDATRETMLKMWNAGKTAAQISAHYGGRYSRSAVAGLMHRTLGAVDKGRGKVALAPRVPAPPRPEQVARPVVAAPVVPDPVAVLTLTLPSAVVRYLETMPGATAAEAAAHILWDVMADDMTAQMGSAITWAFDAHARGGQ